ncbi:MAG: PadR family transcriptional regulator [Tetrasphaera sp.]
MSVKLGLLALLAEQSMYGAQLRSEFEARTGGTWPLNVGQVYTTLARLERDGMVEQESAPDEEGRILYHLTDLGMTEVMAWWQTPVDRDETPRDELVIKLALAVTTPGVDVRAVVQTQRTATLKQLRDLTRLKMQASDRQASDSATNNDLAWLLVVENLIFGAESEVRWLDHVESSLARAAAYPHQPTAATSDGTASEATTGLLGAEK